MDSTDAYEQSRNTHVDGNGVYGGAAPTKQQWGHSLSNAPLKAIQSSVSSHPSALYGYISPHNGKTTRSDVNRKWRECNADRINTGSNKHSTSFHSICGPSRSYPGQPLPSSASAIPGDWAQRPFPTHLPPGTATRHNPLRLSPSRRMQDGSLPFRPPSCRCGANGASCPGHYGST